MPFADELLDNNRRYAASYRGGELPRRPARRVAVLTCMDARVDLQAALGLEVGDAHVLRNAGGVVTEDAIRSLAVSQRQLGTEEILIVHHTDCGMLGLRDEDFHGSILAETGIRPPWAVEGFSDLEDDVRQCVARVKASPFIPRRDLVRGFVLDLRTGELREVR